MQVILGASPPSGTQQGSIQQYHHTALKKTYPFYYDINQSMLETHFIPVTQIVFLH